MTEWQGWTEANKAEAKRLYIDEGRSAREISTALNATSRNAVIGILTRMGVTRDEGRARSNTSGSANAVKNARLRAAPPAPAPARAAGRPAAPPLAAEPPSPPPPSGGKSLVELRTHDCRYPLDGPGGADMRFCGAYAVDPTHPWCDRHQGVVYASARP